MFAIALAVAMMGEHVRASEWVAVPGAGRVVAHVYKKGLFSAFAHDHHLEAAEYRVSARISDEDLGSTTVVLVVAANSLRDRQPSLSEEDRHEVEARAAGPDMLDAQHHPRIEFRGDRFELAPGAGFEHVRGTLSGTLTVRGRSAPVAVAIDAEHGSKDEWRVRGNARLKQTAFGIKPFSGFAGTVAVKDDVDVEISLVLRPGG
jgi:polyisoprenoid-binding protein YceI